MRHSRLTVFALCACFAMAACSAQNAANNANRAHSLSNQQDTALKLAHATESAGDLPAAEKLYLRIITMHPSSVQPRIELAEFYRRHNNTTQAIAAYHNALRLAPDNVTILRDIANTYINVGQTEKAVDTLDQAIAINSGSALLYNSKGVALDMEGHYAPAQESYRTALRLDPDDVMMFDANLSMSYILSGKYDTAIDLLRPLLSDPRASPTIRQNLALAYGMKGDKENALALGLKDLTPEQAAENLKFYGMVAHAQPSAAAPLQNSAAVRAAIRDVFPQDDAVNSTEAPPATVSAAAVLPVTDVVQPPGNMHITSSAPALPVAATSLPTPALRDPLTYQESKPAASADTATAASATPLPLPTLRPEGN